MNNWSEAKVAKAMKPAKVPNPGQTHYVGDDCPGGHEEDRALLEPGRRLEYLPLAELKKAKRNPKGHDVGLISTSIERFGYVEPVIVDERTGRLVAGHGRVQTLGQLEGAKSPMPSGVKLNEAGEWCVPVILGWSSKDDAEAEAFLLATNRTQEAGGWDEGGLKDVLEDLAKLGTAALAGTGYDGDDLDALIIHTASLSKTKSEADEIPAVREDAPAEGEDADEDAAKEGEPEKAARVVSVRPGDLWKLGEHRLLIGDSTVAADVTQLLGGEKAHAVITDPPYAIYGSSTGIGADIADDKMVRPFFESIMKTTHRHLPDFAHAYFFTDWRSWAAMWESAKREGMTAKNAIVWDKGGGGLGSMWAQCYELIGFFVKNPPAKSMSANQERGARTVYKPNILRHNRPTGDDREHNAAKPVELLKELVEAATDSGQTVLELFTGSGSTMIACEQLGRRCFGMEIEPKFAQVAIDRYERFTGKKAEKLGEVER